MIELERASRWYGQVIGLNDVTCQIGPGITALLGPNGAGKSTLIKLITGQLRPTTGSVSVLGLRPFANPTVLAQIGYCPESEATFEEMTGVDLVTMLGSMNGMSGAHLEGRVRECIAFVGMADRADKKMGGYSKGMRQRIKLAQAIVHEPKVIVADEPLNGLDPMGRRDIAGLLLALANQGKCVVVSSHILYEVEQMTQKMILLNRGRLLAQGDVHSIRSLIDKHPHRISISSPQARTLGRELLCSQTVLAVRLASETELEIETRMPERFYSTFPDIVQAGRFTVDGFDSVDNNLESVFSYLVTP